MMRVFLILFFFTTISFAQKTVSELATEFDTRWAVEESWYLSRSTSGDASDLYCLGEGIDGLVNIFRATGNTTYLDDAILLVNNAKATTVLSSTLPNSSWMDGYLTWEDKAGASCSVAANDGNEVPLAESRFAQNVGYLLWVLYESPTLRASGYESDFASIRDFMDVNFWDKWISRDPNWPYKSSVDGSSGWAGFSLFMEIITGDVKYTANVNNFNTTAVNGAGNMRAHLDANTGDATAYQWDLLWAGTVYAPIGTAVSDHPHAGRAVKFMTHSYRLSRYWDAADMTALRKSIEVFWPTASTGASITYIMDGTTNATSAANDDKSGLPEGWAMLGSLGETLQQRFEAKDISYESANQTSAQLKGITTLNRAILNGSVPYPEYIGTVITGPYKFGSGNPTGVSSSTLIAEAIAEYNLNKTLYTDSYTVDANGQMTGYSTANARYWKSRYYDGEFYNTLINALVVTKDTRYAGEIIDFLDLYKAAGNLSTTADSYYDWPTNTNGAGTGVATPLDEMRSVRHVFRFLYILKKYDFFGSAYYESKFNEFYPFFRDNTFDKWLSRSCGHLYRIGQYMTSHTMESAMWLAMIEPDPTKKASYQKHVNGWNGVNGETMRGNCSNNGWYAVDQTFRNSVTTESGAKKWTGVWNGTGYGGYVDVSHGDDTVQFETMQFLMKNYFGDALTSTDMDEYVGTYQRIIDGSPDNMVNIPFTISGVYNSGDDNRSFTNIGFVGTAKFDATVQNQATSFSTVGSNAVGELQNNKAGLAYNQAYLEGQDGYWEFDFSMSASLGAKGYDYMFLNQLGY